MLHVTFDVLNMPGSAQLTFDIALPLGVTNREQIQITPIDANSCRTAFNERSASRQVGVRRSVGSIADG